MLFPLHGISLDSAANNIAYTFCRIVSRHFPCSICYNYLIEFTRKKKTTHKHARFVEYFGNSLFFKQAFIVYHLDLPGQIFVVCSNTLQANIG